MPSSGQHRSRQVLDSIAIAVALGFGSGSGRRAPGTVGSFVALLVWWTIVGLLPADWQIAGTLGLALLGAVAGIPSVSATLRSQRLGTDQDPSSIVIDEWVGMFIALLGVVPDSCWPLIAFGLFRLFDIAKPGPVAWAEHVPGVAGVMLDDIVAGALVVILMHGLLLPLVI